MKKLYFILAISLNFAFATSDKNINDCVTKSDFKSCKIIADNLEKGCKNGDQADCYFYADMIFKGLGVKRDVVKSFEIYKDSCEKNSSEACYEASVRYLQGTGTVQDFDLSGKALEKACKLGSKRACDILALVPPKK